jgi:hypothetical protein
MSKRFTDTEKWKRPWFRTLSPEAKIIWLFLCDNCDHAGIWIADYELASFQIGFTLNQKTLTEMLGDKVMPFDSDKVFIPSFFEFQYGKSKDKFNAKTSALQELSRYGLVNEDGSIKGHLPDTSSSVAQVSPDTLGIGISKGKGKEGDARGNKIDFPIELQESFDTFWRAYPEKANKSQAKKTFQKLKPPIADVLTALEKYKAYVMKKGISWQHASTFLNSYRDCLEPDYGQTVDVPKQNGFYQKPALKPVNQSSMVTYIPDIDRSGQKLTREDFAKMKAGKI